ncbi:MAG: dTDP-4-dehydrorhamnose 3,5-epimerase [Phaeodactylibacter sp.]|nr:dTDP-4-dehydrorhamnose 3,5-epimerase [Phaeodactylibacter sp.]MCB9296852.1 dTDP-4-dehydrorhamnose 3,5-epimerase [Lewinellaceae bacterium]
MPFIDTPIDGLKVFLPKVWADERGYFFESFNQNLFEQGGVIADFVQDNQARSAYGVLRGLHYQVEPYAQAKLVRVLQGEVLDVAVDIREGSPTYGQSYSLVISAENKRQLFIPRGFAHGYVVLSETAEFFYKCDNYYSSEHEGGIRFDDPKLNIDWQVGEQDLVLSGRDRGLPLFGEHRIE